MCFLQLNWVQEETGLKRTEEEARGREGDWEKRGKGEEVMKR